MNPDNFALPRSSRRSRSSGFSVSTVFRAFRVPRAIAALNSGSRVCKLSESETTSDLLIVASYPLGLDIENCV